jgi:hypothetical protein
LNIGLFPSQFLIQLLLLVVRCQAMDTPGLTCSVPEPVADACVGHGEETGDGLNDVPAEGIVGAVLHQKELCADNASEGVNYSSGFLLPFGLGFH